MTQIFYTKKSAIADTKAPTDPLEGKWEKRRSDAKLVNPADRRELSIVVVGAGLAGGAAAASLGEMSYNVKAPFYQDSARRAHSIAAQGGINAAKNYKNDNDSVYRLFYDTIKGGDFQACETNVYHLAKVANNIVDQCVAREVPFTREYGEYLDNRSFNGVQVSRTFYARGQTGQQLLTGACQALQRQMAAGAVESFSRHEMIKLIVRDGHTRGIVARDMITDEIELHVADAVVLTTGGYGNVFFLSMNTMGCNGSAIRRAYHKGTYFASPCCTQIRPTCTPQHGDYQSKLALMSESLRSDGRIWVPRRTEDCERDPRQIPGEDRNYYLEHIYSPFDNLAPRGTASRQAKNMCDEGRGVGPKIGEVARGVYLDFSDAINHMGKVAVSAKYGNLFGAYKQITDDDPYEVPMHIYPAVHYTMDGLWVDCGLESSMHDLYVADEASFSDHSANRLGISALIRGLADGYFVPPDTMNDYLVSGPFEPLIPDDPTVVGACESIRLRVATLVGLNGEHSADYYHKKLGSVTRGRCGMTHEADGLRRTIYEIRTLRENFWKNVKVPGTPEELSVSLEKARQIADFLELDELMCIDVLHHEEFCGGYFRVKPQAPEGEALRRDNKYAYVAAWEFADDDSPPVLHKEDLNYEFVHMKRRSYK